jgi:hypothetical protein
MDATALIMSNLDRGEHEGERAVDATENTYQ